MPKSQADIAKKASLDQTTVGRVLRKSNATSIDKLEGLAKAFGVQPWQLLAPGLGGTIGGLSPKAVEVALLYEGLSKAKQAHLYATAQVLHDPEAFEGESDQEAKPVPLASLPVS
jgi:transcriptional regulator with XRE-family HTH domain